MENNSTNKTTNLALQGGGAHGAYAWGILDEVLRDGRLSIEGVCATSSGAMNACILAQGLMTGGREGAREELHDFWEAISDQGVLYNPVKRVPWLSDGWNMDNSPAFFMVEMMTHLLSPYEFNPFNINPLRTVVKEMIDFDRVQRCPDLNLFISTTHVVSGKIRVFETEEVSLDVLMASAALPYLFQAVEIDGEDYWDGGYTGNPALYPLFYKTTCADVIIAHVNPVIRPDTPKTAPDILNRINEVSFNNSLLQEMRAIAFVKKLLDQDMLRDEYRDRFTDVRVHSIRAEEVMCDLGVASKFNSEWDFLIHLRDEGRQAASTWLNNNYDAIGKRGTVDLNKEFLKSVTEMFDETS